MSKSIVVFGLGRFGKSLALTLSRGGADVMAVDRDPDIIDAISPEVAYAVVADLENADAIKGLGLEKMDIAVVAVGSDLAASIMAVMVSKEEGIPTVIAKAANERMGEILKRVGADKIIFPEIESGEREARTLLSDNVLEFFEIDRNICLIEFKPRQEWIGKSLRELRLRDREHINVVAVKSHHEMRAHIDPDKPLEKDTILLVVTEKSNLGRI